MVSCWKLRTKFVASENRCSCQYADKRVQGEYYGKVMLFCVYISSRSDLVSKLSLTLVLCEKERLRQNRTSFSYLFSGLPCTLRYIREYVCELLGSVILSAYLVWGFVAALCIILLVHQYGEFAWPSLN